jgi:hypothetical protein
VHSRWGQPLCTGANREHSLDGQEVSVGVFHVAEWTTDMKCSHSLENTRIQ